MWIELVITFVVEVSVVFLMLRSGGRFAYADIPNHRSLHDRPTPTGGGVAIVLGGLVGGMSFLGIDWLTSLDGLLLVAGVALVVMGFVDDRGALTPVARFLIQILVAVTVIVTGLKIAMISVGGLSVEVPWWLVGIVTGLFVVWMINLYNFMDGMDGLAAAMAIVGFGALGWLGFVHGDDMFAGTAWIIAASSLGFLMFNFPPARIFMGDTGSTVLGYAAAVMILWADQEGIAPLWIGILIFSPFIVDSTVTLVRRGLAGERLWEPHRTHYYQRVVGLGWSHRRTLLAEIVLMLACALSALIAIDQSPPIQWLTVALWLAIYPSLMYSVHRMEASSPRKS